MAIPHRVQSTSSVNWRTELPELSGGADCVDLWLVRSDDPAFDTPVFWDVLSSAERERAGRFHFEKDRRSYRVTHAAKRLLLGFYLKRHPESLEFGIGEWGKPFLEGTESSLRFNLSHSKGMTLIGISQEKELGVDVELFQPVDRMEPIFERFASPEERRYFKLAQGQTANAGFALTRWWVGKEAFIKAVGRGLSLGLSEFSIDSFADENVSVGAIPLEFGRGEDYEIEIFRIGSDHLGAMVFPRPFAELCCYELNSLITKLV